MSESAVNDEEPQPGSTWRASGPLDSWSTQIFTVRAVVDGYVWYADYPKPGDEIGPGYYMPIAGFMLRHMRCAAPLEFGLDIDRAHGAANLVPLERWNPEWDAPVATVIIYHNNKIEVITP